MEEMRYRRRSFVASLAMLALAACGERRAPSPTPQIEKGEPMTPKATVARPGIPPIDAAVPAKLETATFALG